ncbi:hypothetical protein N656DRAFT_651374 [Canariomyces notabilis]|uniref:Uncharacterized protein n=1 Tax=Canariomyces notabilis TaxID=2074819 RepID=A0AAN6YT13_9PEZI|nr:hypothetical protein N656DRAFT_651374 [Canariomyces arenarius]
MSSARNPRATDVRGARDTTHHFTPRKRNIIGNPVTYYTPHGSESSWRRAHLIQTHYSISRTTQQPALYQTGRHAMGNGAGTYIES